MKPFPLHRRAHASDVQDMMRQIYNPHTCGLILYTKHPDRFRHPANWKIFVCKADDFVILPHGHYSSLFECGQTSEVGITVVDIFGQENYGKRPEYHVRRKVREGVGHRHIGPSPGRCDEVRAFLERQNAADELVVEEMRKGKH